MYFTIFYFYLTGLPEIRPSPSYPGPQKVSKRELLGIADSRIFYKLDVFPVA